MKTQVITKAILRLVLLVIFFAFVIAVARGDEAANHKLFLPAILVADDTGDILRLTYEYALALRSEGHMKVSGGLLEWSNQNWDNYVLWFHKVGDETGWCIRMLVGDSSGIRLNPQLRSFLFAQSGVGLCQVNEDNDHVYEVILADNKPGDENNKSDMVIVDLRPLVVGTAFIKPPFTVTAELCPPERSGDVLLRWTNGYVPNYSVFEEVEDGPCVRVLKKGGDYNARSSLMTDYTPGDVVTFYIGYLDNYYVCNDTSLIYAEVTVIVQ